MAKIDNYYKEKYRDSNAIYTSGSSSSRSSAQKRYAEGMTKGSQMHENIQSGNIKMEVGETIKIISHSQGGAHAAGVAAQLLSYKNEDGSQLYNVEIVEYITPHQPTDIYHPEGVRGIQYSHPNDAVSSEDPWWLPNGGSEYGKINGIGDSDFYGSDIMGGTGQPPCGGVSGNRCGHNVTDNDDFIKQSEK